MKNLLIAGLIVINATAHAASEREDCHLIAETFRIVASARDAGVPMESIQKIYKENAARLPGISPKFMRAMLQSISTIYEAKNLTPAVIYSAGLEECQTKADK
jgi:hypothetical protein